MSSRFLIVVVAAVLAAAVGCQDNKDHSKAADHGSTSMKSDTMNASADACPHCAGVQTANADGKCPVCGAQVVVKQ